MPMPHAVARSPDPSPDLPQAPACAAVRRRGPSLEKTTQTQRQITEAALAAFLEQGITRTTMAQIASRAGVAKGTIYLYYPSKVELLRGVVLHSLAQSAAYQPLCRRPGESPEALLRRSLMPTMEAFEYSDRGALARLILTEARQHPELAALYKELAFDPWHQHVLGLLQLASDEGALPAGSVQAFAYLLGSPFWLGMVHNGLLTHDPQQQLAIAPLMDKLIAVLFAGAAALPAGAAVAAPASVPSSFSTR